MPIRKVMKGVPVGHIAAKGLMKHDHDALTPCQRECTARVAMTIQMEQEAYLTQHPEIFAMLELFISDQANKVKRQINVARDAGEFFLRPFEELDADIRKRLDVGPDDPYVKSNKSSFEIHDDENLENDLNAIVAKHNPPKTWTLSTPSEPIIATESSSFISALTSDTTLPTPEPTPIPEPTISEYFMTVILNTLDKAVYTRYDDQKVLYDAAYMEVSKAVEEAMEIPVYEIKEDIAQLFFNAFKMFELDLDEKQRIAAAIKWEKRMRKKIKRTLRRQFNFKGFESPPSTPSASSRESSLHVPPPRPCVCHPQWHYNRLAKDRFGIYLPRQVQYPPINMTVTPVLSVESSPEESEGEGEGKSDEDIEAKSVISTISKASKASKKPVVKFK